MSELMVAGYHFALEHKFTGGTNSSVHLQSLQEYYGREGLVLHGHSRGSMVISNATRLNLAAGKSDFLSNTQIYFYGPAQNAKTMADLLHQASGGAQDTVYLQNHGDDPIGRYIGRNPATPYYEGSDVEHGVLVNPDAKPRPIRPADSNKLAEIWQMVKQEDDNPHGCYGTGKSSGDKCGNRYGTAIYVPIHAGGKTGAKR